MQGWLLLWVPDWGPPHSALEAMPALLVPPLHWPRAAVSSLPYLGESENSLISASRQESTTQCPKGFRARNQYGVHLAWVPAPASVREEDKEANCTERSFSSLQGNPVLGSQI